MYDSVTYRETYVWAVIVFPVTDRQAGRAHLYDIQNVLYKFFILKTGMKETSRRREILQFILNLLKPTGHVMHQQFNIQQLYVLPTLYLCVLYLSENKQQLVPLTA